MVATPPDQRTLGGAVTAEAVGAVEGATGWGAAKATEAMVGKLADTVGGRLATKFAAKAGGKPEAAAGKAGPAGGDAAEAGSGAAPKAGAKGGAPHESPSEPADSGGGGGSRGCNSFVPGTKVLLAGGKTKSIEDVKVGDKVVATDPETGKTRLEPVIAAFGGTAYKNLVQITVDTDGKRGHHTGVITATEHHKFWDRVHHRWIRADHLAQGATLRTPTGSSVRVVYATVVLGHPTVRDLTVADLHTYYVEADTTPVLVHNCGNKPVKLYRSPGLGNRDSERFGLNAANHEGDHPTAYLSNKPEGAADYAGNGHDDGFHVFTMKPGFRERFGKFESPLENTNGLPEGTTEWKISSGDFGEFNSYIDHDLTEWWPAARGWFQEP